MFDGQIASLLDCWIPKDPNLGYALNDNQLRAFKREQQRHVQLDRQVREEESDGRQ